MTKDDAHIRIELVANPIYLGGARELVSAVAKRLGFEDAACSQVALAVDEALCNIIRHGYGGTTTKPIWMSIWPVAGGAGGDAPSDDHEDAVARAEGIRIVIEDEARQVDPTQLKGRDLDDIKPGGLGVHIIREVMDEAVWEKRDTAGMRLTMMKRTAATTAENTNAGNTNGGGSPAGDGGNR